MRARKGGGQGARRGSVWRWLVRLIVPRCRSALSGSAACAPWRSSLCRGAILAACGGRDPGGAFVLRVDLCARENAVGLFLGSPCSSQVLVSGESFAEGAPALSTMSSPSQGGSQFCCVLPDSRQHDDGLEMISATQALQTSTTYCRRGTTQRTNPRSWSTGCARSFGVFPRSTCMHCDVAYNPHRACNVRLYGVVAVVGRESTEWGAQAS
ncbi:hypothetical protein BJ546DRAFT_560817 [Cryomyces antarcticus]